jgi:prolyl 4-hydroxylase
MDPVSSCIRQRVAELQGFIRPHAVESLQVTWYETGQHFKTHDDVLRVIEYVDKETGEIRLEDDRWNRTTTGFATLDADCQSCGTQFPFLKTVWKDWHSKEWCRILDCSEDKLTIYPIPGSVIFWQNVRTDGQYDIRLRHAGLPIKGSRKIGLNIWSRVNLWDGPVQSRGRAE